MSDSKWEVFAQENPYWYILAPFEGTMDEFWDSGSKQAEDILLDVKVLLRNYNTAIEIGTGVGRCLIPMCSCFGNCVGVDISPTMLDLLRKFAELKGVEDRVIPMFPNEPWYDYKADFIYSVKTLYYIHDLSIIEDYIEKISRCLDREGIAYLQFDTRPRTLLYHVRNTLPDFLLLRQWRRGIRRIRWGPAILVSLFEKHGLRVLDEKNICTAYHIYFLGKLDE